MTGGQREPLSGTAREIIAEEEALLARVQAALETARAKARGSDAQRLLAHLQDLRDEATTAAVADLPHLIHQMDQTRALLERQEKAPLPDALAPYFAHLRLRGPDGARDYLFGRTSFADTSAGVRVIDWRYAPIAKVFYCYGEGDEYEEYFGDRLSEGTVEVRRLVVIERGVLTRISVGGLVLQREKDGAWREVGPGAALAGGSGTAARPGFLGVGAPRRDASSTVTALLDAEQYEAIGVGASKPLLVLGGAGSGKTTVALHRLAKIAFDERDGYSPARMKVVVPEEGLAALSRRLLDPLGLGRVSVQTLDEWAYATARSVFDVPRLKLSDDTPHLVARLKRHPALRSLLPRRVGKLKRAAPTLKRLRERLGDAFVDPAFLKEVVSAAGGDLPTTAVEETVRHTKLQLARPLSEELEGIDPEALVTVDGQSLESDTPDALAGTMDFEDLPLLMFLKAQQGKLGVERLAHVVLDEAEDFSLFEIAVVRELLGDSRSCTLAGDEMQQTHSSFAGWPATLAELGVPDAATCRLQVSYRCPRPVAEFARKILGEQAPAGPVRAGREGAPVGFHHFPDEAQAQLFVGEALRDLMEREPHASVAVIASNPETARALHRVVSDHPWARLVLNGGFTFEPGVDVTDVDNIKGLEFDYVVLPDATAREYPFTDEARRRLHVAATRASYQLWVVSAGVRSPLVTAAATAG